MAKTASKTPARKPRKKAAPAPRRALMVMGWVMAAVLILDQLVKYWVLHVMQLDRLREIDLLPPWLNLRMAWNQGVNFGLFASSADVMRWVLIGAALVVCALVWLWMSRERPGWVTQAAAGLLVGGAVGNVIDRLFYGAVVDFLNMSLPNWRNPYSFNVADIAIFIGALGLILWPPGERGNDSDKTRDAAGKSS